MMALSEHTTADGTTYALESLVDEGDILAVRSNGRFLGIVALHGGGWRCIRRPDGQDTQWSPERHETALAAAEALAR